MDRTHPKWKKVESKLVARFKAAEEERQPYEAQWRLNLYWLVGRQYAIIDSANKRIFEPEAPSWRIRLVANRILPIWRSSIGRLLRTRPIPDVIPASGDEQEVLTAKVGDKLLKHIWIDEQIDGRKSIELYGWLLACGSSFLVPWWDHDAGDPMETDGGLEDVEESDVDEDDDVVSLDRPRAPAIRRQGKIRVDVASPFEVYPDHRAASMEDLRWIFRVKTLPVGELRRRYPEFADQIHEESDLELVSYPFGTPPSPASKYESASGLSSRASGMARLKEYFEAPTTKFPNGRHGVMVGDVLVEFHNRLPYDHGAIPLVKFDFIVFPGRFWGGALIEQLIPLQREYNRVRSMLIENRNMMSRPKLLVPTTAAVSADAWTTEVGEKIYYNPQGGAPTAWVPPPIPGYVLSELDRTEADMMEVASYHWATRGVNPPGVRTAAGIALLQEADDTPFGPVLQWNEHSWREAARQVLELARQFYTEPRIVYTGLGSEAEAAEFSREDISGRYRLRIDMGSSLPMSRAARMQFGLEMLDRGMFRDEQGRIDEAKFFEFLEMEAAVDVFKDDRIDIKVARTENVQMRDRFQHFEAGEYDNHVAHLDAHIRFMKELAAEDPTHEAIAIIAEHVKGHELRMREAQLKAASEQIAIQAGVEQLRQAAAAEAGLIPPPGQGSPPPGDQGVQPPVTPMGAEMGRGMTQPGMEIPQ